MALSFYGKHVMTPLSIAEQRYTCKAYDPTKKIPDEIFTRLLDVLRLTPSSINIQAWQFLVARSDEAKAKITQAMPDIHQHNVSKVQNCDSVIIFCAKTELDDAHLLHILNAEEQAGRFANAEVKQKRFELCQNNLAEKRQHGLDTWLNEQLHIALGTMLFSAQMEGVDSTAIGGFDNQKLDDFLQLSQQGLRSVVMLALGYASADDFNRQLPKARLTQQQVIQML